MSTKQTYYEILSVSPDADLDTIKKQYRRIAQECHPDHGSVDTDRFTSAAEAYETLSNPSKRASYDATLHFNHNFKSVFMFDPTLFNFGLYTKISRSAPRINPNIKTSIAISMEQAYIGCRVIVQFDRQIECNDCGGTGLSANKTICTKCNNDKKSLSRCSVCAGTGHVKVSCLKCQGSGRFQEVGQSEICISPQTVLGSYVVIKGAGNKLVNREHGDVYVLIRYAQQYGDVICESDGTLYTNARVAWDRVLLGETYTFKLFPTCKKNISFILNPNTPDGSVYRLAGLGMAGKDLLVKVQYTLPLNIDEENRKIIAEIIRNAQCKTNS